MAPGPRTRRSPRHNPPGSSASPWNLASGEEASGSSDEGTPGPSNAGTPVPTPAPSRASTPAPAPGSDFNYTEGGFQRVTKLYVDSFVQAQTQLPIHQEGPPERPLKARFSDLYFGKFHMITLNTSNLFCSSSMLTGPQESPLWSDSFEKASSLSLRPIWSNTVENSIAGTS